MPEPWRPGLPPDGTVCDVRCRVTWKALLSVRMVRDPVDGPGCMRAIGGDAGGCSVPPLFDARESEWRPIHAPDGVPDA